MTSTLDGLALIRYSTNYAQFGLYVFPFQMSNDLCKIIIFDLRILLFIIMVVNKLELCIYKLA